MCSLRLAGLQGEWIAIWRVKRTVAGYGMKLAVDVKKKRNIDGLQTGVGCSAILALSVQLVPNSLDPDPNISLAQAMRNCKISDPTHHHVRKR